MERLRKIRNAVIVISVLFCWGIVGSIELERLTLADGISFIVKAAAFCAAVCAAEFGIRAAKVLIVRYARRRRERRYASFKLKKAYAAR